TIYPHLNLTEPSHRIPWDAYPVAVPTSCVPWRASTRRAVVNSFGFAGTIAVAVLEQAPAAAPVREAAAGAAPEARPRGTAPVFPVPPKTPAGLRGQIESSHRFADASPALDVARLCYTPNVGRAHLPHRLAGVASSRADLLSLLAAGAKGAPAPAGIRKVA